MESGKTRKKPPPLVIAGALLLLTAALLLCSLIYLKGEAKSILPSALVLRNADGLNLTFEDGQKLGETATMLNISRAVVSGELALDSIKVNLNITDENYQKILPIKIVRGSYFYFEELPSQNKFAVISDKLAVKLFRRENAVGEKIAINSSEFIICGVYRAESSLLCRISGNGNEDVFIPYKADNNYEALPVHMLYIQSETKFMQSAIDNITEKTGKPPTPDSMSDYGDVRAMKIPARLLPQDNILDFSHYFRAASAEFNGKNSSMMYDFYWNYSINCVMLYLATAAAMAIAVIAGLGFILRIVLMKLRVGVWRI